MVDLWLHDIESLEAVTQDEHTKRICLRMAAMSQAGTQMTVAQIHPCPESLERHLTVAGPSSARSPTC